MPDVELTDLGHQQHLDSHRKDNLHVRGSRSPWEMPDFRFRNGRLDPNLRRLEVRHMQIKQYRVSQICTVEQSY